MFLNAQELHKEYPETFECPNDESLNAIGEDDYVKVCHNRERFWVKVVKVDGDTIQGIVDNDLVYEHPFAIGDLVTFRKENIYDIYVEED